MKIAIFLVTLMVGASSFATVPKLTFQCQGQRLDENGNESGKGTVYVQILNNAKQARLSDESVTIDLKANSSNLSGHNMDYVNAEGKDGIGLTIMTDLLRATPNGSFYAYLVYRKNGLAIESQTLTCERVSSIHR